MERVSRWDLGGWKRITHAMVCVVGFELWQFIAFGFAFGVLRLSPADMWKGDPIIITTTAVSGTLLMVCLVWLGIVRLGRISWRDLGWHTERLGLALGLGAAGTVLLSANVLGVLAVSGQLAQLDVLAVITGYTVEQRVLFLVIGAAAAATEESVFRGYLQPALIAKGGLVAGILVGAVIFALYHAFMGPSLTGLVAKILGGVILGALRGRDGSLVAPALAHFAMWQIFGSI